MASLRTRLAVSLIALAVLAPRFDVLAEERGEIAVAAPWHVSGIDPSQDGYTVLRMAVGETLVCTTAEGDLVPALATAWEASDDGLVWTFALRNGVSFHDGTPMTAEAAVASLERARAKPGIMSAAPIEAIEAGEGAVVIRLSRPFAALPAILANYATMILAPTSYGAEGTVIEFIATGPLAVETVETPLSLATRRFEGYWGEKPAI